MRRQFFKFVPGNRYFLTYQLSRRVPFVPQFVHSIESTVICLSFGTKAANRSVDSSIAGSPVLWLERCLNIPTDSSSNVLSKVFCGRFKVVKRSVAKSRKSRWWRAEFTNRTFHFKVSGILYKRNQSTCTSFDSPFNTLSTLFWLPLDSVKRWTARAGKSLKDIPSRPPKSWICV